MQKKSFMTYTMHLPLFRFIAGYGVVFLGLLGTPVFAPLLIFMFIGLGMILGVINDQKVKTVFSYNFVGTDGQKYSYTVFKKIYYARCPFPIIRLMSIFTYMPYASEYYLVEGTGLLQPGTFVDETFMSFGHRNWSKISGSEARRYKKNPQRAAQRVEQSSSRDKANLAAKLSFWEKNGIVRDINQNSYTTICEFTDGINYLVSYSRDKQAIVGLQLSDDGLLLGMLNYESDTLNTLVSDSCSYYISVNTVVMNEQWEQVIMNGSGESTSEPQTQALEAHENSDMQNDSGAMKAVSNSVEAGKQELTREILEKRLKKIFERSLLGIVVFWFLVGVGGTELTIALLLTGLIPLALVAIAVLALAYYLYFKRRKRAMAAKKAFEENGYQLLKRTLKRVRDDSDEDGTKYIFVFDNGAEMIPTQEDFSKNVYEGMRYFEAVLNVNEKEQYHCYFSGNVWRLSDELKQYWTAHKFDGK